MNGTPFSFSDEPKPTPRTLPVVRRPGLRLPFRRFSRESNDRDRTSDYEPELYRLSDESGPLRYLPSVFVNVGDLVSPFNFSNDSYYYLDERRGDFSRTLVGLPSLAALLPAPFFLISGGSASLCSGIVRNCSRSRLPTGDNACSSSGVGACGCGEVALRAALDALGINRAFVACLVGCGFPFISSSSAERLSEEILLNYRGSVALSFSLLGDFPARRADYLSLLAFDLTSDFYDFSLCAETIPFSVPFRAPAILAALALDFSLFSLRFCAFSFVALDTNTSASSGIGAVGAPESTVATGWSRRPSMALWIAAMNSSYIY